MDPSPTAFHEKVVIVTGASAGIGKEVCLALARERARLVLAARDESRLNEVAAACRSAGATTLVVPTDVTSQTECQRLVTRTLTQFGGIDVLVNNAGTSMYSSFEDVKDLAIY